MIRRLNLPVTDEAVFTDLTAKRHPLGMRSSRPQYQLLRETYFDTSDGALQERGMTLRIRAEARGVSVLELSIAEEVSLQGVVCETALQTPIVDGGLYATLAAHSDISTRIRDVVQPEALRPRASLDIDRETRELKVGVFGRTTHRIWFDEVIAHGPGVTRTFQEVTITELSRGAADLEALAARLRDDHGIVGDGRSTYERILGALAARRGVSPSDDVPYDVRVALMLLRDWEVALVDEPDGLRLPTSRGTGEEIAREYLLEVGGPDAVEGAELDLVGFATARRGGSDLEVWLHERLGAPKPDGFIWIPLVELMERLGGPRLRDSGLVATMLMLVRSETGQRLLREAPQRRAAPRRLPTAPRSPELKPGEGPDDFLDLDLSILDFNQRVLELAEDGSVPLLERIRFLSIFSGNSDEFFMVRVARLKQEVTTGSSGPEGDLTSEELLDLVAVRVRALAARQYAVLSDVLPRLAEQGTRIVSWEDLKEDQKTELTSRFDREIFPLLTPLSMVSGPGRSFPRLVSLELSLAVVVRLEADRLPELACVPIPSDLGRLIPVPGSADFIPIESVIGANVGALFPSSVVEDAYPFRATRLGDVELDEDNMGSLLAAVADQVAERRYKPVIRIEVSSRMPREVRASILKGVRTDQTADAPTLTRSDVYEIDGPLDLAGFAELCDMEMPEGLYPPFVPDRFLDLERSIFEILAEGDVLCHHPYQDFDTSVGRFLREAATDPDVVSIKLTLYRTGRRSPVVDTLLEALASGKDVAVFVELKARFDEESNIHWTHRLREAGARVVYGVVGYKTHAKTALVVRREADAFRRYVHVGTGNYNAATARFYTDLGLMSADPDLGADLNDFFNELTGAEGPPRKQFRRLLVAPGSLVQEVERMIRREIEHARAGRPARIQAKLNGLADRKVVRLLYEAAREGVRIDLVVRSICTLRPGVEGLSDGIEVRSVLGRFLEHGRVIYFENAGQGEYYIGSADWRARNLRRRVEVVTPVDDPAACVVLRAILDRQLEDPRAWVLRPDGAYERLAGAGPTSQEHFLATGGLVEMPVR